MRGGVCAVNPAQLSLASLLSTRAGDRPLVARRPVRYEGSNRGGQRVSKTRPSHSCDPTGCVLAQFARVFAAGRGLNGPRHCLGGKIMRPVLTVLTLSLFVLTGCLGRPALRELVLGYDETISALEQQILLSEHRPAGLGPAAAFHGDVQHRRDIHLRDHRRHRRHHIRGSWC